MKTISFYGSCPANSSIVLVSKRIRYAFTLEAILATFTSATQNQMLLRFFIAHDRHAPDDAPPNGVSMLLENGQVDYITGAGMQKRIEHRLEMEQLGAYLKVYAVNNDTFAHICEVQMFVRQH